MTSLKSTPAMTDNKHTELVERLRRKTRTQIECINGMWEGWQAINPDGPEAATTIESLSTKLEEARGALRPFAIAADDLDDKHGDHSTIWEAPAAMEITAGHLRKARTILSEGEV